MEIGFKLLSTDALYSLRRLWCPDASKLQAVTEVCPSLNVSDILPFPFLSVFQMVPTRPKLLMFLKLPTFPMFLLLPLSTPVLLFFHTGDT